MDGTGLGKRPTGRARSALLAASLVLAMTTWFSASAVVPQLREAWALGDTGAAWLTIAVQLGFVAGALVSSVLNVADVVSPRIAILTGAAGAAVANALLAAVSSAGPAIPLRFLTGFFLAGVYPPALKLMATWFRRGRGTALGILVGALTLGSATPHLVNALGGLDWQTVVYATSALTLAGGSSRSSCGTAPTRSRRPPSTRTRPAASLPIAAYGWPASATSDTLGALRDVGLVRRLLLGDGGVRHGRRVCDVRGDRGGSGRLLGRRRSRRSHRPTGDDRARDDGVRGVRARDRPLPGSARLGRARDRARLGLHRRRRLGAVLDPGHGARRPSLRRHGADDAARGRLHADRRDDLADAVLRRRGRLALGVRVPRAGPRARRPRDAATPSRGARRAYLGRFRRIRRGERPRPGAAAVADRPLLAFRWPVAVPAPVGPGAPVDDHLDVGVVLVVLDELLVELRSSSGGITQ